MDEKQKECMCPMIASTIRLNCIKERCAWWVRLNDEGDGACSIRVIAKRI